MSELDFHKMHGLGNDFVIVDQRSGKLSLSAEQIRQIGDRRRGVGFDQLLLLEPSQQADVFMRVYNPDGSEAGACGNGTRCVARLMMEEHGLSRVRVETVAGVLEAVPGLRGYTVKMGKPKLAWDEIPLATAMDTLHLDIEAGPLARPTAVSMGNPHAVFFVDDADAIDLAALGPELERYPLFPERANIGVAQMLDRETIRLRVFERGAGITNACGSGACAALVAAVRRDLCAQTASVRLDGGTLRITWGDDGQVLMTGPATHSFKGSFEPDMLVVNDQVRAS
jgi:diaminopimelate epimerase